MGNEASYSSSSAGTLEECERQFYLAKYGTDGGWYKNASDEKKTLYMLKNMTGRHLFSGNVVHGLAERAARRAMVKPIHIRDNRERLLKFAETEAVRAVDDAVMQSLSGGWAEDSKRITHFSEHQFGEPLDPDFIKGKAISSLRSLFAPDEEWKSTGVNLFFQALDGGQIQNTEKLTRTHIGGMLVWTQTDLTVWEKDTNTTVVIDYKTGKYNEKHDDQAMLYGVTEMIHGASNVGTALIYLPEDGPDVRMRKASPIDDHKRVENKVAAFAAKLAPKLVDGDLKRNLAVEDMFAPTTDARTCSWCSFRSVCGQSAL